MILKIIDIGSNSVKASLYGVEGGDFRLLDKSKLPFALGEEVFSRGTISEGARDKVAAFLASLPSAHGGEKVHFTFMLATSAVRSARNREDFARALSAKVGAQLRILTGEEESYLIHMGIVHRAGAGADEVIKSIDIGGGSAEISWSRGQEYLFGHSFELGAIRLAQRFPGAKLSARETQAEIRDIALAQFRERYGDRRPPQASRAFGSSGNLRAIGKMAAWARSAAFQKSVAEITPGVLDDLLEVCAGRNPGQIQRTFDIPVERARIVVPALAVLRASMGHFDIPRLAVSESGLREGAIFFWSRHGHLNLPGFQDAAHQKA